MRILNQKVGTVPGKFECQENSRSVYGLQIGSATSFRNEKLCFHFAELLYKYKNYLKTAKRQKFFENFA